MGYNHAIQMVEQNGGTVNEDNLVIMLQAPEPVKFEQAFEGHFPIERKQVDWGKKQYSNYIIPVKKFKAPCFTGKFLGVCP